MAFCPKCGRDAGTHAYCTYCGSKMAVNGQPAAVQAPVRPAAQPQRSLGQDSQRPVAPENQHAVANPPDFPMKWHKFMIYVVLWANAALNAVEGAVLMSYAGQAPVMAVLGIACIALAGWAVYVRFQLAGLRAGAPKKLLIFLVANAALSLLSALGSGGGQAGSVAGVVANAIWNWRYYTSREELFVN